MHASSDCPTWGEVNSPGTAPSLGSADFDAIYVADTGLVRRKDGLATGNWQMVDEIAAINPLLVPSFRPRWESLVTSLTPRSLRATKERRKEIQNA